MTISILIDKYDNRSQLPGEAEAKKWIEIKDSDNCLELAMKANNVRDEDEVVLFINLDVCTGSLNENGATLLEYIRFAENLPNGAENRIRDAHCVLFSSLYSFETTVRKYPEQTILYSPGTTFLGPVTQDPFDVDVNELCQELFDKSKWEQTVRKSTFIETDNHSIANWWGVHKLAQVHSAVTGTAFQVDEIKPELEKLENLRTIAFYSAGLTSFVGSLDDKKRDEIATIRSKLGKRKLKILHIDDDWANGWSRLIANIFFGSGINQSDEGSSLRIYGNINGEVGVLESFRGYSANDPQKFANEILEAAVNGIKTWSPDCILLDLRLAGSKEGHKSADELSGVLLLQSLREQLNGIPVIITTASNKAWSIENLLKNGADAYWIKDSADGSSKATEGVESYIRLIKLAELATGEKYRFLKEFAKSIEDHIGGQQRWYRNPFWNMPIGQSNIKRIDEILNQTVSLLRMYLHASVMGYEYRSSKSDTHFMSSLVTHSFHTIEIIHNPDNLDFDSSTRQMFNLKRLMDKRQDHLGNRLRQLRNKFAHLDFIFGSPPELATFESLRTFLIGLYAYLAINPLGCQGLKQYPNLLNIPHYRAAISRFSR